MTRPPIIGITTHSRNALGDVVLPGTYVDAIHSVGGSPILLPTQADPTALLSVLDGLVLSGGGDIDPIHYGGENHPTIYGIDDDRDAFEITLAKLALNSEIPVLGICRGMQVLAVATGNKLIPHLPDPYGDEISHRLDNPRRPTPHRVSILPNTRTFELLNQPALDIVSWHHQAVCAPDSAWRIAARSSDGVIEAIEHTQHAWAIGLQWHPELSMYDPAHQCLFRAFVAACQSKI